jgi:hypothetical protein
MVQKKQQKFMMLIEIWKRGNKVKTNLKEFRYRNFSSSCHILDQVLGSSEIEIKKEKEELLRTKQKQREKCAMVSDGCNKFWC